MVVQIQWKVLQPNTFRFNTISKLDDKALELNPSNGTIGIGTVNILLWNHTIEPEGVVIWIRDVLNASNNIHMSL